MAHLIVVRLHARKLTMVTKLAGELGAADTTAANLRTGRDTLDICPIACNKNTQVKLPVHVS